MDANACGSGLSPVPETYNVLMRTAMFVALLSSVLAAQSQSPSSLSFKSAMRPKHAVVTAGPLDVVVEPGGRKSLLVEVTPSPNIHVYAPGAKDFIPIAVTIEPQAGLKVGKLTYPKSEIMSFEDEKVPVFQHPFQLTQEITVLGSVKPGTAMIVRGTVDYQACDDKVCYAPESVSVTWTVAVR